ncbi:MAG: folate-binding protein YgfZ [Pseudomonadota bacterium]|nr:folate-binding protein YgfZ [Pseudomonadota bacterium]MEC9470274.1 folate-binding protein YgfZ [Pseudomonadota bacterium]
MSTLSYAHLSDRSLIRVGGAEAQHFLQNLVTADIDGMTEGGARAGALLTPQGKILFDFLIYRVETGYLLDAPSETAADLLKRLTFYRLRAKVELELLSEDVGVIAVWDDASEAGNALNLGLQAALACVTDPRLPALGMRISGSVADVSAMLDGSPADVAAYDLHRISKGVPEGLKDYDYSDIFPHDADLDQLGGVSFSKGCYVGQEVVSRMQHRGSARKRFVQIESGAMLPEKGADIMAGGKSVGALGSSAGTGDSAVGLALLRLDKVAQAKDNGIPLQCGDAEILVKVPDWASFSLPEPSTAD